MKRTYIAPVALSINIEAEELIAASMKVSETQVNDAWSNERTASQSIWDED